MEIITNLYMTKQWRFPRSKRKRIRNKWKKNKLNFKPDMRVLAVNGDTYIMHPAMKIKFEEMNRAFDEVLCAYGSASFRSEDLTGTTSRTSTSIDLNKTELLMKGRSILSGRPHRYPCTDEQAINAGISFDMEQAIKASQRIGEFRARILDFMTIPAFMVDKRYICESNNSISSRQQFRFIKGLDS